MNLHRYLLPVCLTVVPATAHAQRPQRLEVEKISQAAGVVATTSPDGVVRVAWARTDVAVQVDGVTLPPFAGLGSWAALKPSAKGALLMGDEVVFEDEVSAAVDAAVEAGLEVTALHNHFFYDVPRVFFMHIGGSGNPERLAAGVKAIGDAIKQVRTASPQPATVFPGRKPAPGNISATPLEEILGHKSDSRDGVVKITIGRAGKMHGEEVGGSSGLATWAAFTGSDDLAAVDGDFMMTAAEVQPVLKALRHANIHIVALHQHMIGEAPSSYFTHFWGVGPAAQLARGLKAALDTQSR